MFLGGIGADVPECFASGTVSCQLCAPAAFVHSFSGADIDIGEEIFVGCSFVVVEADVKAPAAGDDVACAVADGDVVKESGPV